jgi:conjugal transfer pilus assembly protein TraV
MTELTPQQLTGFRRAVERRSGGQVCIPSVDLERSEAIALWQNLVAAFGEPKGRALSPRELALLRERAWRRSAGHIALSQSSLTLPAGLALWNLAGQIETLLARRSQTQGAHSGLARAAGVAALGLAATQLAACTSLWGGNIKGNFACSAPGGTCAPSTVIDDQALAVIQNARPMVPASGPYFQPPARASGQSGRLVPSGSGRIAAASTGVAHRERRVLKVVFPSYVDGAGNFHEPRVVHTVADAGGWMQLAGANGPGGTAPNTATSLADPQPSAARDPLRAEVKEPGSEAQAPSQSLAPSNPMPDPKVVAEARAKAAMRTSSAPVDAIRAEVEARLGAGPKTVQPTAASHLQSGPAVKPASGAEPAAQGAPQIPAASAPLVSNPPAIFSGKVEE